jgi:hypothetical protein
MSSNVDTTQTESCPVSALQECELEKSSVIDLRFELEKVIAEEGCPGLCKRLRITKGHAYKIIRILDVSPLGESSVQPKMTSMQRGIYRKAAFRAQQKVCRAVKSGEMPSLKKEVIMCADCKTDRAVCYDHRDYAFPLDVSPVCHSCNLKRGPAIYSEMEKAA